MSGVEICKSLSGTGLPTEKLNCPHCRSGFGVKRFGEGAHFIKASYMRYPTLDLMKDAMRVFEVGGLQALLAWEALV